LYGSGDWEEGRTGKSVRRKGEGKFGEESKRNKRRGNRDIRNRRTRKKRGRRGGKRMRNKGGIGRRRRGETI
jgi:hypothetical protein